MIIDLRSDTLTKPSQSMLAAMMQAEVGDNVFNEDPTITALEEKVAQMFGHEAALFCPSGTMTNQIAISVHTQPGDEVICEKSSHVYKYEGGGIAVNSSCSIKTIEGTYGKITPEEILANINPDDAHFPVSKLVSIENSTNIGGGNVYSIEEIKAIYDLCKANNLIFHLDGARIFNALVTTGNSPKEIGQYFDSISICLSKGLGAPVGSVLLGSKDFIYKAHRRRKVFGGGMRQAGYLAAAGIYALDNNIDRLADDHKAAKLLSDTLSTLPYVKEVLPVKTNIVIFKLDDSITGQAYIDKLAQHNIIALSLGPDLVRFVLHLDVTSEMVEKVNNTIKKLI